MKKNKDTSINIEKSLKILEGIICIKKNGKIIYQAK